MFKKFIIGIVVIIFLVIAGLLVFSEKIEAPSSENLESEDIETAQGDEDVADSSPQNGTATWNEFDGEIDISTDIIESVIVNYTESGFSPKTVSINNGQTVKFINNSNGPMWVATDFHPSHNIYPEFDARKGMPAGSTYEFKFNKPGSWNYHDHLNANQVGTVIVK